MTYLTVSVTGARNASVPGIEQERFHVFEDGTELIGYKSPRPDRDGKRRGVKVRVSSPEGSPKLDVWTKSGYYR